MESNFNGIDLSLLVKDQWYVVRDLKTDKWPYTQARAVKGPFLTTDAAWEYTVMDWGERPLRWTGTAWEKK